MIPLEESLTGKVKQAMMKKRQLIRSSFVILILKTICNNAPNRWHELPQSITKHLQEKALVYDNSQFVELKFLKCNWKQRQNRFGELLPTTELVWVGKMILNMTEMLQDSWVDFNFWKEKSFISCCQKNPNQFIPIP